MLHDFLYLGTHGFKGGEFNAFHSSEGFEQIENMEDLVKRLNIQLIVTGTGKRFTEMMTVIRSFVGVDVLVKYSKYLGSEDSVIEEMGRKWVLIAHETKIPKEDYLGCDDAWRHVDAINQLANGVKFLCSGKQFLEDLHWKPDGFSTIASIFELDPVNRTVQRIIREGEILPLPPE